MQKNNNSNIKDIVDVISVEDSVFVQEVLRELFLAKELSYRNFDHLNGFIKHIREGNRARFYVLDGIFPRFESGEGLKLLGFEAYQRLKYIDKNARVAFYSEEKRVKEFADEIGIPYFEKQSSGKLVDIISKYISSIE